VIRGGRLTGLQSCHASTSRICQVINQIIGDRLARADVVIESLSKASRAKNTYKLNEIRNENLWGNEGVARSHVLSTNACWPDDPNEVITKYWPPDMRAQKMKENNWNG